MYGNKLHVLFSEVKGLQQTTLKPHVSLQVNPKNCKTIKSIDLKQTIKNRDQTLKHAVYSSFMNRVIKQCIKNKGTNSWFSFSAEFGLNPLWSGHLKPDSQQWTEGALTLQHVGCFHKQTKNTEVWSHVSICIKTAENKNVRRLYVKVTISHN